MDLHDYLHVLRRRWKWVALGFVVALALAGGFIARSVPQYQASTQVFISTQSDNDASAYQGGLFSGQRVASYADLAGGPDLAAEVIADLDLDLTPAQLAGKVTAQAVPETVLLRISVTDADPTLAKEIAASYAEQLADLVADLETPPGKDDPVLKATTVESASTPTSPVSPNIPRILALAGVLGLLLGFGLGVLRELLDTSVKSAGDLEAITPAPLLGSITNDASVSKKPLVGDLGMHHPRVEAFRMLRTNLQFVDVDAPDKAFVVSSAVPGEGKTSTVVNTAITLAMAGKRVLLVDADLRRPRGAPLLGLDGAAGLTSVLVGQVGWRDVVQSHESGLDVMTSGAVPPNPAELLQSNAMSDLIIALRKDYEVILFDTPPLLPVTDAAILASKTDGAVLVIRQGKTSRERVRAACTRLTNVGAHPLGVVFNRVPGKGGSAYGYGYGYAPSEPAEPAETQGKRRKESAAGHSGA